VNNEIDCDEIAATIPNNTDSEEQGAADLSAIGEHELADTATADPAIEGTAGLED
jgi:hypothetical protein